MAVKPFECVKCGQCCREIVIPITYRDVKRWVEEKRQDIVRQVTFCRGAPQGDGFYFEQTITAPKKPCPFLIDNECSIHSTKPMSCRDAPDGLTSFPVCRQWSEECIDKRKVEKIRRRQHREFEKCVIHFKELLEITLKAKGLNLKVKINDN